MRGPIPPLPQYVFMAWCLVKHRDNFTLPLPYLTLVRYLPKVTPTQDNSDELTVLGFDVINVKRDRYLSTPRTG
jgi:hypothetical protein